METTVHRTTIHRTTIYRTDSSSNRQFIEPTVYLTDSLSKRKFVEFVKTKDQHFKCTHAKSLSNFIKPNNSVLNAHTQLFYRILLNPI